MKRTTFLIPHFRTWRWSAVCVHALKTYGIPVEQEIILIDNSPGHPSIKAITETSLGEGIKVISGNPKFTSHGHGYCLGEEVASGDHIFTAESDSFPIRHGWFDPYVEAVGQGYDLIGPEIPQGSGRYIHPAGALVSKRVLEAAKQWRSRHDNWLFCPGAAPALGLSDKGYHVVARSEWLYEQAIPSDLLNQIELWSLTGAWQEMRAFEDDSFDTYMHRKRITHFTPQPGRDHYLKIGYEAGQWLAYFAEYSGFKCLRAPVEIEWMPGRTGRQAAGSTVFGGFRHVWAGSVSLVSAKDMDPEVVAFKTGNMNEYFSQLPVDIRTQIEELERRNA